MTVFRQENVDDYYDTGEELGRYQEGVTEARGVCGGGLLKPALSLAGPSLRWAEEPVPNQLRPGTRNKLPDPRGGEATHSSVTVPRVWSEPLDKNRLHCVHY